MIEEGQWWNGLKSGYGREIYDEMHYVGDFQHYNTYNRRHGFGTYVSYDGNTYVGPWKDGKPHGQGKYTNRKGKVFTGNFVESYLAGVFFHDL